jgi:hypothetical protein
MDKPWFRRFGGFSYVPTCWEGSIVILLMAALVIPLSLLFLWLADSHPILSWICAATGFSVAVVGHAVVFWKMDDGGYDRP